MEDVTATDGARKRSWWEEILSKKDQEMNQLQNQIDMTKITTVYNMVELLCGSSYNFVLSRLYRCAYDYDSLSSGEIKALLKTLIQVLRLFGVQTSGEDLIGTKIPAGSEEAKGTVSEIVPDMEEDCVVFPGWNVAGDAAVLPVVCRRSEEEKR